MSAARSPATRLADIAEAIERIRHAIDQMSVDQFEQSWERRWLVERGLEIVSEASRGLPAEIKARHPHIPWPKVAGIGSILRHDYHRIAADVLWKVVREDLPDLEIAVRRELAAEDRHRGHR